jgi:hypothetical protein
LYVTSPQVPAPRAFLGWTQELLADKALVALTGLKRLESDRLDATRDAVRKARGRRHRITVVWPPRGRHAGPSGDKKTGRRCLNR